MLKATSSIVNVSQIVGVLPVVNGGTGVTTSTGTGSTVLSAAPTLSGNVTLSTGNLVVADTKGIDFSATPGTGTSELLNDYEEGTYTPTVTSGSGSFTTVSATGRYTKIGRVVTVNAVITITNNGTAATNIQYTLPFATTFESTGCGREMDNTGDMLSTTVTPGLPNTANIQKYNNTYPGGTGFKIQLTMTYIA